MNICGNYANSTLIGGVVRSVIPFLCRNFVSTVPTLKTKHAG